MKAIFGPIDSQKTLNQLQEIADHYNSKAIQHDTGEGYFIFVKDRIAITEKIRDNKLYIFVWGAKEEDISFLKQFWGEPRDLEAEKMSPMNFASEVVDIPNVEQLSKEEIITSLEISEKEYNQYLKQLKRVVKRPNTPPNVVKAVSILKDK